MGVYCGHGPAECEDYYELSSGCANAQKIVYFYVMTKIKLKDIYKLILKVLPISPSGDLLVEVEKGKRITLTPPAKEGIVGKTSGILESRTTGVKFENSLRRQEEKRIARETSKH